MLCPKCGKDVGDQLDLCEDCKSKQAAAADSQSEILAEAQLSGSASALDSMGMPDHFGSSAESSVPTAKPAPLAGQLSPAGFWMRVLAFTADGFLLMSLLTLLYLIIFKIAGDIFIGHIGEILSALAGMQQDGPPSEMPAVFGLLGVILLLANFFLAIGLPFLYYTLFESSPRCATPGKVLFGLVATDNELQQLSFNQAALRNGLRWATAIIYLFFAILAVAFPSQALVIFTSVAALVHGLFSFVDPLCAAFTSKKQTIRDILAGTMVMKNSVLDFTGIVLRLIALIVAWVLFFALMFLLQGLIVASFAGGMQKAAHDLEQSDFASKMQQMNSLPAPQGATVTFSRPPNLRHGNRAPSSVIDEVLESSTTSTLPRPLFPAVPQGALGYAHSKTHNIFFREAIAIHNPHYNWIKIGFFEKPLQNKIRSQILKQGRFALLKDAGPNMTLLLNFNRIGDSITTQDIDAFSAEFYRRSSSAFDFSGTSDIASFRRSLFDLGDHDAIDVSGTIKGEKPSIGVKAQGTAQHRRTGEVFKWKLDADINIIKRKKRKASRVKNP